MASETINTEIRDLHNWIIANRGNYPNITISIKIVDERSLFMLQSLERLQQQKNQAIEMYLYLYDKNAEGDINTPLHFLIDCNNQIKKLIGL